MCPPPAPLECPCDPHSGCSSVPPPRVLSANVKAAYVWCRKPVRQSIQEEVKVVKVVVVVEEEE